MDVNVDSDEPHRSSSPSQASAVDVAYSEDNRGRKRIRQPAKWKKNIRKRRRACGLEYISTSGKTVPKKHLKLFDCRCPLKCCTKLNAEQQQIVHDTFYDTSDWSVQTAFIASQTKVSSVAHRYTKSTHSRRNYSKHFYLPVAGVDVRVCKTFFKGVLCISDGRLARATNKKQHGVSHCDQRGRHPPHNKPPPRIELIL